jgi:hypothetical protein
MGVAPPTVTMIAMVIPVTMIAVVIPVVISRRTKIVLDGFADWRHRSGEGARHWR